MDRYTYNPDTHCRQVRAQSTLELTDSEINALIAEWQADGWTVEAYERATGKRCIQGERIVPTKEEA